MKKVGQVMVPLEKYAVVSEDSNLRDAILSLREAQKNLPQGREPCRAVLVSNKNGKIVGKIDQFVFVKHLGSSTSVAGQISQLDRYGVHSDSISSVIENIRFLQEGYLNLCRKARSIRAKEVMQPVTQSISENAPLQEAIEKMGNWQAISMLVTQGGSVVGILRLSDVFQELAEEVVRLNDECD